MTEMSQRKKNRFRQNSHLLAAIQFNGTSFYLQVVITMTISNCDSQSALYKHNIYSTQWLILHVIVHVMHNIAFTATDVASKFLTFDKQIT